jgi:hypothetical protein
MAENELEYMISTAKLNDEMLIGVYTTGNHWHYRKDAERMERYYNFVIPWQRKVIESLKREVQWFKGYVNAAEIL